MPYMYFLLDLYLYIGRDSHDVGVGTPPGHASVVLMFEAAADNWGSGSAVSAPAISKVMGGAQEQNKKIAQKHR